MTERTRWDALAEELADEPSRERPNRPRPKKTPEDEMKVLELRARRGPGVPEMSRRALTETTVLVTLDGRMIPAADVKLSWSIETDLELVRLGVLTDEEIGRRPVKATGSFTTTRDATSNLSGRDLTILVR